MSNALAIAAVTTTLQAILQQSIMLDPDFNDVSVTIQPLDLARGKNTNNQLNLFLYMVARNAAWVNADMPRQVKPGESSISPLPLNLYFLLTAFGRDDDTAQAFSHELLGLAMRTLYDNPILSSADIRSATQATLARNDLDQQLEHVRITLHPLTIDELSKLWTGFSMQYRLSAAYEAAVTLIESTRVARAPLPVLTRGPKDQGISAQGDLTPPLPTLSSIALPKQQPSALLGDVITLAGVHLDGTNVGVRFNHALWTAPVERPPLAGGSATALSVQIPNAPADWPAGFYNVEVLVQRAGESFRRVTNQLSFSVAPSATVVPLAAAANTPVVYTATVSPEVRPAQVAMLMLGAQEFLADRLAVQGPTLTFSATLPADVYWVRLRVDGVDTLLVDRTKTPPVYAAQQVTVT
ncbi:MAG TPA: DUF4255 domain-containing protein [Candidatus Elarobacter sp.]|nr:DUF4255 domain-containing protein [Candidatus Elarobacter sp.]